MRKTIMHGVVHCLRHNYNVGIIRAMRFSLILFAILAAFLPGCGTTPSENDQQAFESSLSEAQLFMMTLHTLDSGDIAKTRQVAFTPVCVDLSSLPYFASRGHPTHEQRQQMVALAGESLDYMIRHKDEFDPRLLSVSGAIRGLRQILTEPEDVRRLDELSDYFTGREKKMSDTQRP